MGGNVVINGRTAVTAGSGGVLSSVDVCKTPRRCRPQPYINVARSADAAKTAGSVIINGHPVCHEDSIFSVSTGDEPGTCGGVKSGTIKQKAEFLDGSPDTYVEGKKLVRQFELMTSNNRNTPPAPLMQAGAGRPPAIRPEGAAGLEESALPHKLEPLLVGNRLPHFLTGRLTALGKDSGRRYESKLGASEAIGADAFGLDRWPIRFPFVAAENHSLFLSYVDKDGALDDETAELVKARDYPDNHDMYHIPLGPLLSIQRDETAETHDLELMPTYPLRLVRHDDDLSDTLRDGWLYLFIAGKLWREIRVEERFNRFIDVNLTRYQGQDRRPANTQAQESVVLLPRHMAKYSGAGFSDQTPIQAAFSEVQWSWAYIERLGGMHRDDPRHLEGLQRYAERREKGASGEPDSGFRRQRLQTVSLTRFNARQAGAGNARSSHLIPLAGAVQAARAAEAKAGQPLGLLANLRPADSETGLPGLVLYDAVGEARARAALFHTLLLELQDLMRQLSGRLSDAEKQKLTPEEIRAAERQAVNYRTACVLSQYLYVSLATPLPEGLSEEERAALQESLEARRKARADCLDEGRFFAFTKKAAREQLAQAAREAKDALVAFLDDRDSRFNFTTAMQDHFTLSGGDYYLHAMRTLGEITRNLLKDGVLVDAALHLEPLAELEHIDADKGLKLLLNLVGCGDAPHPLSANMFPEEIPPARDEDSSLYDFRDIEVPAGDGRFSAERLRALLRGVDDTPTQSREQQQVLESFGGALGAWSETHANIAHTLFTAAKAIRDARQQARTATGKLLS
ncbi:MAG TPA: DUF4150 domain-containing protein, partial [Gammaproteobacteria bacterium]|nr:DUF4150 domain-containing protein [Gammaproteobacteria bacterium]